MALMVQYASAGNLERLYTIEKECFSNEAFTKRQISQFLTDYNSVSLIAIDDDQIVGFIIAIIYPERRSSSGHVITLDVSLSHRRKGVGTMLLEEMESIFIQKGVQVSVLEVREDNVPALSLYGKLGYREAGRLRNYYKNAHGIYLRKALT